jgi:hypothetical protein
MRTLFNNCSLGQASDVPDAIVTDQTSYELFEDEVQEQKMIMSQTGSGSTDATFTEPMLSFKGKPITWSFQCTAGYLYMLNFKYLGLNVDPDINMTATELTLSALSKSTLIKGKNLPDSYDAIAEAEAILNKKG